MPWAVSWSSKAWVPAIPAGPSLSDLGRGAGSSAGALVLQTAAARPGKDGCRSLCCVLPCKGLQTIERVRWLSVMTQFYFYAMLCWHSKASCLAGEMELPFSKAPFHLIPPRFPLCGNTD